MFKQILFEIHITFYRKHMVPLRLTVDCCLRKHIFNYLLRYLLTYLLLGSAAL
jgi:hypothetical protein